MSSTLSSLVNHQVRLASRPVGMATADNWQLTAEPVAEPADGQVLVKTLVLSLDPAMRGWLNDGKSYIPPVGIGEVMRAGGIGRVIASKDPAFALGDVVSGLLGVQEYCQAAAGLPGSRSLQKIDLKLGTAGAVAQRLRHAGHDGLLRPARRGPAPARRHAGRLRRGRRGGADAWASWPRSGAAAWSASPAARRSATGWSRNWASTPASTTRAARCAKA